MAKEYLARNATSLAATSWYLADGTTPGSGFSGAATLIIDQGGQAIVDDCDQSGSTTGIESLDIMPDFTGKCGDDTHPFKFDADGTSESLANVVSRVKYWAGTGWLYYHSANGCHILQIKTGGKANLVGGGFKHVHLDDGSAQFTDQTTCTASGTWYINGGTLTLEKHASNTFNVININGGGSSSTPHGIYRGGTTLAINNGRALLDVKNGTVSNINMTNGYLQLLSHNATGPTLNAQGGTIDFSKLARPITLSSPVLGRVTFVGFNRSMVTLSSPQYVGGGPIGIN